MKPLCLLVLFSLLASPALLAAQVVARQGSPAESPLQEFKSPMVLDLPIKDFKDQLEHQVLGMSPLFPPGDRCLSSPGTKRRTGCGPSWTI
jgi:hypothetical protein